MIIAPSTFVSRWLGYTKKVRTINWSLSWSELEQGLEQNKNWLLKALIWLPHDWACDGLTCLMTPQCAEVSAEVSAVLSDKKPTRPLMIAYSPFS